MGKILIKPAPGVKLYNPFLNRFVLDAGETVEDNKYWSRRIAEGGAVRYDPAGRTAPIPSGKPAPKPEPEPPVPEPVPEAEPVVPEPELKPEKKSKKKSKKK